MLKKIFIDQKGLNGRFKVRNDNNTRITTNINTINIFPQYLQPAAGNIIFSCLFFKMKILPNTIYKYGLIILLSFHHYWYTVLVTENLYGFSRTEPTRLDMLLQKEEQREVALFSESAMYYSYFRRTGNLFPILSRWTRNTRNIIGYKSPPTQNPL